MDQADASRLYSFKCIFGEHLQQARPILRRGENASFSAQHRQHGLGPRYCKPYFHIIMYIMISHLRYHNGFSSVFSSMSFRPSRSLAFFQNSKKLFSVHDLRTGRSANLCFWHSIIIICDGSLCRRRARQTEIQPLFRPGYTPMASWLARLGQGHGHTLNVVGCVARTPPRVFKGPLILSSIYGHLHFQLRPTCTGKALLYLM